MVAEIIEEVGLVAAVFCHSRVVADASSGFVYYSPMTRARILYWKEVPVQVQAEDDSGQVSRLLASRFQEGVDQIAMFDGSEGSEDYLDGWAWGGYLEAAGTAAEVADRLADRYSQSFPGDFVRRIRELHESGKRKPHPGAVDGWME